MANSLSSNFYQSLMQPGELLLWHGAPGPGKLSSYGQVPILFSIIWLGFSLVWEAAAIMSGVIIMILFGLPFVLIGLSIAFGGPIRNARLKGKIFYAVTDQRLLIQEGNEISIYTPDMLPPHADPHEQERHGKHLFPRDLLHASKWAPVPLRVLPAKPH